VIEIRGDIKKIISTTESSIKLNFI